MKVNRVLTVFLAISNICFVVFYLYVCYHNRLAADDFHFMDNVLEYGVWDGMRYEYRSWSSRYSSVLVNHSFLALILKTGHGLMLFGLLSLILMVMAWRSLLEQAAIRFFKKGSITPRLSWNLAIFCTSILYFLTVNIGETWHWLCSAATYLWSVIAWIYLLGYLLNRKPNLWQHMLVGLAAIYIGGAAGPLSLITLILIPIILTKINEGPVRLFSDDKRYVFLWLLLAISFFILYRAEGNVVRSAFFESIGLWESFTLNIKMTGIVLFIKLRLVIVILGVVFIPSMIFDSSPFSVPRHGGLFTRAIVVFGILLFFYQWPITYKTQDIAAERALFPITTAIILISGYLIIRLYPITIPEVRRWTSALILVAVFSSTVYYGIMAVKELPRYNEAYDQRIAELTAISDCSGKKGLLPLPTSGILKSAELSKDIHYFSNQHLREALNIPCEVYKYPAP